MNENEIMNEEIAVEETNVDNVVPEIQEDDCVAIGKLVIGAVGVAVALTALYKNQHKIIEWNIKRCIRNLEKKGYTIHKIETEEEVIDVTDDIEETEE